MYIGEKTKRATKKALKILKRDNCKKILAWTEEAKNKIMKSFPEIKDKLEVVYPAIPEKKFRKTKGSKINIIFSGRYFYAKGGVHAVEAIDQLTKRYPQVHGIINSEVPEEIKKKYSKNKKIKFYGLMPQKELFKLYKKSDIMIYPGYSDSFGFGFLEAMSFGIPIITSDGFARKEIVEDRKTGFVVERPEISWKGDVPVFPTSSEKRLLRDLEDKAEIMIKNRVLREKMSKNCIEIIRVGKFSIKERNKRLEKIYEEALK